MKKYAVLPALLVLGGCMMSGMAAMGSGGTHGSTPLPSLNGQTLVKESVVSGIQITAEFPGYVVGDELVYRVTLRDAGDRSPVSNASLALVVTVDESRNGDVHAGHAGSPSRHGDSSRAPVLATVGQRVFPQTTGDGTYVFRPSITTAGFYRFVFVLESIGQVTSDPPGRVEHVVQLDRPTAPHSGSGNHMTGSGMKTGAAIGAIVMAVMMFVMFR